MIKQPIQLLQSGFCMRWHSNPDMSREADDLAQHQWNVAAIVLILKPDCSKELLVEALTHDVGEMIAGDLSYDFKINNTEIAKAHKEGEEMFRNKIVTGQEISDEELQVLKAADWLSSFWWVANKHPILLNRKDWKDQADYFLTTFYDVEWGGTACELFDKIAQVAEEGYTIKMDLNWKFDKGLKEYEAA